MSHNHLIDSLMEAMGANAEKVPKGWSTPAEIRQKTGKSERVVERMLARALKNNTVERRKFRVFNESHGYIYPTVHYREIKR